MIGMLHAYMDRFCVYTVYKDGMNSFLFWFWMWWNEKVMYLGQGIYVSI